MRWKAFNYEAIFLYVRLCNFYDLWLACYFIKCCSSNSRHKMRQPIFYGRKSLCQLTIKIEKLIGFFQFVWLIGYLRFYVPLKNFSLIWRRHHSRWLGLCSALTAFEQGGIFIVPHLLWHGTSVYPVSSEGPAHSVASYDTRGNVEDLF
jgi:hypothetical protein